jgi:hypothetical protein
MRMTITAVHPERFPVQIEVTTEENENLSKLIHSLLDRGYRPPPQDWARTPDGLPICLKHQAVMRLREKQGDSWHAHRVRTESGQELWCRGFAHGDEEVDGFCN